MASRRLRLLVVPALLFVTVSSLTLALAQTHLAKPEAAAATGGAGDPVRGETLFADECSACHGQAGRDATVGPDLAGNPISLEEARTQIQVGSGAMPANLVEGQALEDVLAYLGRIVASEPLRGDD